MRLRRGAAGGGFGETFLPCPGPYVTKLLFRKGLRRGEGLPSVPADLARGHSGPPPDGLWSEKPVAWAISDNGVCVSLSRTHFVPSAAATDTCAAAPPTESLRKLRFWIISSKSRYVAATTLSDASQKSSQMITA